MLFFSQEFKHKTKLKLAKNKFLYYGFLEPIYKIFWKNYVKKNTDDFSTSPVIVAEIVKEIIKGKKVCDIGCRKGFLLSAFAKYASEVVGIEKDENFCQICRNKGLNVINGDVFEMEIPEADVYYFWFGEEHALRVIKKLREQNKTGLVIRGFRVDQKPISGSLVISCPRRRKIETDFKIQIIKL